MWGKHVVRLSGGCREPRSRCYSSLTGAVSVSEPEFLKAFLEVYPRDKWKDHESIGLAISGGVDSMALATLYSTALKSPTGSHLPQCHGIIIDHKFRPESTEEAKWVSEQLKSKLGIESTIVPLTWPKKPDSSDISIQNFESMARQLRNQAIGRLCRDKNLKSFMLAHHLDDQAEGMVLRLMRNRLRTGLTGMKPVEWISECHGIHGVYHSSKTTEQIGTSLPFPFEGGGIQVLRPLLGFSKSRLIATCKEHGTAWAEDKTNQDVTLTNRNTIRHVIQHRKLPAALCRDSLVSLAMHMKKRLDSHQEIANNLFEKCPMKLDIQTGSLVVRLPPVTSLLDRPILTHSDILLARTNAILLVSRLASLVSPTTGSTTLGQLTNSIDVFYPALRTCDPTRAMLRVWERPDSAWANVWFRRWNKPSPFRLSDDLVESHTMEWLMNRRPIMNNIPSLYDHQIIVPTLHTDPSSGEKWHLFDDRYWMRVKNYGTAPLKIRNFEPNDVKTLAEDVQKIPIADRPRVWPDHLVKLVLTLLEDKRLRRGFPGIFWTDEEGRDILAALPTFNITVRLNETANEALHCDIRYKKIDIGNRPLDEIVVPGVTKAQIADAMEQEYPEDINNMADNTNEISTKGIDEAKVSYSERHFKNLGYKVPTNPRLIEKDIIHPTIVKNKDSATRGFKIFKPARKGGLRRVKIPSIANEGGDEDTAPKVAKKTVGEAKEWRKWDNDLGKWVTFTEGD